MRAKTLRVKGYLKRTYNKLFKEESTKKKAKLYAKYILKEIKSQSKGEYYPQYFRTTGIPVYYFDDVVEYFIKRGFLVYDEQDSREPYVWTYIDWSGRDVDSIKSEKYLFTFIEEGEERVQEESIKRTVYNKKGNKKIR